LTSGRREPILAAVGSLQFDVVRFRLESEYGVESILEPTTYVAARWVSGAQDDLIAVGQGRGRLRAEDRDGRQVVLFSTTWDLRYAEEHATGVEFASTLS